MASLSKRLEDVESALVPQDVGRVIICDLTDLSDAEGAEAERRLAQARLDAGPNGVIVEVLHSGQKSYADEGARRVEMDFGDE